MRVMDLPRPAVLATVLAVTVSGCGRSPITTARLEPALATTFANLVHLQVAWLGLPPMAASDFAVHASCRRLTDGGDTGSGDWVCTLVWQGPESQPLRDTYDLFVATDGCYTATVEGGSLGGPVLKSTDGREVKNLLFKFEGCFDTT
jgi:hypothetical protein